MLKLIRSTLWWNTIVPQVLGWIYFALLSCQVSAVHIDKCYVFSLLYPVALYFFLALMGIASFGYLFNDLCDIVPDTNAGKHNSLALLSNPQRVVIVSISLLIGLAWWCALNSYVMTRFVPMTMANFFLMAQILTLVLYSAPPFRMKERALAGVALDSFYGHLNPVLITLAVFRPYPNSGYWYDLFMIVLIVVCTIKGIRNILLHQIEDRKQDNSAKANTIVLKYGPWRIINFINHYLFPAEIFFLVCLTITIGIHIPPLVLPLIFFTIISYLKFSGWKLGYADRRLIEFKFTYFMNDYYEGWFPVFTLIILSIYSHRFVLLLILHLILFPRFITNLIRDFKNIRENFKTEEDY